MAKMGFLTNEPAKALMRLPSGMELIRFDSGRAIGLDDANRHTGVFGNSGSGKTSNYCFQAMENAIANISTILIFDPKGALYRLVYALAKKYGRMDDVVTIGTIKSAKPLNILRGMSQSQFFNFGMEIFRRFADGGKSHNMDFHAGAISTAADAYVVIDGVDKIAQTRPDSPQCQPRNTAPTLPIILELLGDCREATKIFQQYLEVAEDTPKLRRFARKIKGSLFHVLNQTKPDDELDNEHRQQVSYYSAGAARAFSQFLEEEGIVDKFCCPGAPGLDLNGFTGKIVLLSFLPGAGGAAACICRMVIEAFYAWVYKQGVGGARKIIIADEYQEYADLSSHRLSDPAFLAMAREFNCGYFLLTQSYSGIAAKYGEAGLDALVSNLNNKIFLHSEDPLTNKAAKALGSPDLIDLQKSCFAVTYDSITREYTYGVETANKAYARSCQIPRVRLEPVVRESFEHSVEDISAAVDWLVSEKKRLTEETRKPVEKKPEEEPKPAPGDLFHMMREREAQTAERRESMARKYFEAMEESGDDFPPFYDPEPEPEEAYPPDDVRTLFPDLFQDKAEISIPSGFMPFVKNALEMMSAVGLELKLIRISFSQQDTGRLEAYGKPGGNLKYFNRILALAHSICAKCGAEIDPNYLNLCKKCSTSFPKVPVKAKKEQKENPHA